MPTTDPIEPIDPTTAMATEATDDARAYDLVLLGATGFTGRLTAQHLAARLAGTPARWAVAGRDADRLAALAGELPDPPDVEVVDVHDLVGLLALARRTRVLATTVGPYARHGELVVQACVRAGTHYADITGEPAFVRLISDRYDGDARSQGVKLVSCCGFDSVPHDLGVRFTVSHLPDDVPITVRGYVSGQGRASGGTAHSALEAIAARDVELSARPLTVPEPVRHAVALTPRIHRVPELDAYGVPMPTVDPLIVLRSAQLLDGYGSAFRYGHYVRVRRLPTVVAGLGAVGVAAGLARLAPTRALLRRVLPAPGEGPDEATRARSRFAVTFLGRAGAELVTTRVSGGDPGYDETARMLGEAALSLAFDAGPDRAGALSPAAALGQPYHDRLVSQGLRFERLSDGSGEA